MEIYLIRHTTPKIDKGICYGQSDIDVTDQFEDEVAQIMSQVKFDNTAKIYSSPLKRCTKLATKFSEDVFFDNRLKEIDFGDWENKKWDSLPKLDLTTWMDDFVNVQIPNGETYNQLYKRANEAFYELTSITSKKIIITTHGGVIRSILANINNVPLHKSFSIKVEYGQVFKILKNNNIYTVI